MTVGHSVTLHGCYVERGLLIGIGSIVLDDVRVGAQSPGQPVSLITPGTIIPPLQPKSADKRTCRDGDFTYEKR